MASIAGVCESIWAGVKISAHVLFLYQILIIEPKLKDKIILKIQSSIKPQIPQSIKPHVLDPLLKVLYWSHNHEEPIGIN